MPYRRLPKTDQARLHALQKAIRQAENAAFNDLAINYKTRTEAQRLLMQYENQVAQYHANFDSKVSANRQYRHRVRNARMYISHFIQVLNLAVIRGEIKRSQKELYHLNPKSNALPDLTTEEGLLEWGQHIIDGEMKRTAAGGFAIYNPSINKVKVHYDMFKEDYTSHLLHKKTHNRVFEDTETLRKQVDTIILDEVSMVRCDIIDGMDRILRTVMKNTQPFGGKQIIFSGDLYQLEPVFNKNDKGLVEFFYNEYNTESPYFYYAHVFKRIKLPRIEFRKVYRQNDEHFLSILDNVRSGCYVSTDLMMLNNTALRNVQNVDDDVLTLTARNETADTINANRLAAIDAPQFTYIGKVEGDFQSKRMPVQQELILKEGARVMFCRNDKDGCRNVFYIGWYSILPGRRRVLKN